MTGDNSKKIKTALALFTALLMAGCSQNTSEAQETSKVTTVSTTTKSAETTKQPEQESQESQESAVQAETMQEIPNAEAHADNTLIVSLLEDIKNGDNKAVCMAMDANYDFFDDITLESYTYSLTSDQLNEYTNSYDVTLNINSSKSDLFPQGESKWRITTGPDAMGTVCEFFPLDKADEIREKNDLSVYKEEYADNLKAIALDQANQFSHATGIFDGDKEFIENYECDLGQIHLLYHSIPIEYTDSGAKPDLVSDILAEFKNRYNLSVSEEAFRKQFGDMIEGDYFTGNCGHGGSWTYQNVKSFEETGSNVKITLDYYGDCAYFLAVKEVEYTFDKNSDVSITVNSVKTISDNGYEMATGSV